MANEANVQVRVDDSQIDRLSNSLDGLSDNLNTATRDTRDLGRSAGRAERDLKKMDRAAAGAERSTGNLGQSFVAGAAGGAAMAAATATLTAAFELAKRGAEFLIESIRILGETNEEVGAHLETLSANFNSFRGALAGTIATGETGSRIFGALNGIIQNLTSVVNQNENTIRALVERGFDALLDVAIVFLDVAAEVIVLMNNMRTVFLTVELAVLSVYNGLVMLGSFLVEGMFRYWSGLADIALNSINAIIEGINLIPGINIDAEGILEPLAAVQEFTDDAANSMRRFTEEVASNQERAQADYIQATNEIDSQNNRIRDGFAVVTGAVRDVQNNLRAGVYDDYTPQAIEAAEANYQVAESSDEVNESLLETLDLTGRLNEAGGLIAEGYRAVADAMRLAANEADRLAQIEREGSQKMKEALSAGMCEKESDALKSGIDDLNDTLEMFAEGGATAAQDALGGIGVAAGEAIAGGESFAKASKAIIGDVIGSLGRTYSAAGAAALIGDPVTGFFPNPARGAALLAAGTAMSALASALGGKGGGKKGGSRGTPRQSQEARQNITFNQTTSFGFVGDRRAATREIEEINRQSVERGLG